MSAETPATQDTSTAPAPQKKRDLKFVYAYLAGYGVLLVLYVTFLMTGSKEIKPLDYLNKAFPGMTSPKAESLKDVMTDDAHIQTWVDLTFDDLNGLRHHIAAGSKLTAPQAVALAQAIHMDKTRTEKDKAVPVILGYTDTQLNINWAYIMTFYNLAGLFLLLYTVAAEPLTSMIDAGVEETQASLESASKARAEAERLKQEYEKLLAEVDAERKKIEETAKSELAEEREHILRTARHEAEGIIENVKLSVNAEALNCEERLRGQLTSEILASARTILESEIGTADHQKEFESFLDNLKGAKLS